MSSILPISNEAIHLLSSSQVITSVYAVVKELVENSLDAEATSIEVKLERFGLDLIEVRDNGSGIKTEDVPYMAMPHFTSKLHEFNDIHTLRTYGFRGEALTSIAAVSDLSITTCTETDEVAFTYTINHAGKVVGKNPGPGSKGTVVSVKKLFQTIPVRKQYYKSDKRCREELKKVEDLLLAFGIAHHGVRLVLKHNRSPIWQKIQSTDHKANLALLFGPSTFQQLSPITYHCFNPMVRINAFLPKPNTENISLVSRSTADRLFVLVNKRPVDIKPVVKLVRRLYLERFPSQGGRFPVAVVRIDVPPSDFDVNLDPNKSQVLLENLDFILTTLESLIRQFYGPTKQVAPPIHDKRKAKEQDSSSDKRTTNPKKATLPSQQTVSSTKDGSMKEQGSEDTITIEDDQNSHVDDSATNTTDKGDCFHGDQSSPSLLDKDEEKMPSVENDGDREKMEAFELLDVSELEQDFSDDFFKDDLSESGTDHEMEQQMIEENRSVSVSPLTQVTLSQWSRGEISSNKGIQPVKVLQPSSTSKESHTSSMPKQSKLVNRGPSSIFDMINYKPVKRKADSSPSQLLGPSGSKRQKQQLPTLLDKLVHKKKEQVSSVVKEIPSTCTETVFVEQIASRISASAKELSKDPTASVVGYCDPPGVWLVRHDNNIRYFHRPSSSPDSEELMTSSQSATSSRDADLEFIKDILSSSGANQEDYNRYLRHLCTI